MKKLLIILTLIAALTGCKERKSSAQVDIMHADKKPMLDTRCMTIDELNHHLDSLNAIGEYCLVRGSTVECDTIIDHVHYIYVKDK